MLQRLGQSGVGASSQSVMTRRLAPQSLTQSLLSKVTKKAKGMYKQEQLAYQGAFLAQARTALLPYLQNATRQKNLDLLPDRPTEDALLRKVYDEVNELYTDEHLIMTQADMLEQMYRT